MTSFTIPTDRKITAQQIADMDPKFAEDLFIWMRATGWTRDDRGDWFNPPTDQPPEPHRVNAMWGIRYTDKGLELFINDPGGKQVAAVPLTVDQIVATGRAFAGGGLMDHSRYPEGRLVGCSYSWVFPEGFPKKET